MESTTTNAVKASTALSGTAAYATSSLSTMPVGSLLELIASAVCGAAIYIVVAEDEPIVKRVILGLISVILGVTLGPYVGSNLPWIPEPSINLGAALTGACAVAAILGILKLLTDGHSIGSWVDQRLEKMVHRKGSKDDERF